MKKRRLAILGSTGSIGTQALEMARVASRPLPKWPHFAHYPAAKSSLSRCGLRPRLAGLVQPVPEEFLDLQSCESVFRPEALTLAARRYRRRAGERGRHGGPERRARRRSRGERVLADKEALVAGGHGDGGSPARGRACAFCLWTASTAPSFSAFRERAGIRLPPSSSTCSGGPFRTWTGDGVEGSHERNRRSSMPTGSWDRRITIDCPTLFNKALEMMKARWLLTSCQTIEVVVHPRARFTAAWNLPTAR